MSIHNHLGWLQVLIAVFFIFLTEVLLGYGSSSTGTAFVQNRSRYSVCIVCCFPEEFLLDDYSKYTYLSNGHMPVPGVDDTQEFRSLVESMTIMGFSPEDQSGQSSSFHASPCCKTWWKKNLNLHLEKTVTNAWSIWDSCSYEKCIVFFFLFFLFFFFLWLLKNNNDLLQMIEGIIFSSSFFSHILPYKGPSWFVGVWPCILPKRI